MKIEYKKPQTNLFALSQQSPLLSGSKEWNIDDEEIVDGQGAKQNDLFEDNQSDGEEGGNSEGLSRNIWEDF